MDDQNADIVGYEYTTEDGARWRVTGTDAVLGLAYVNVRRVRTDGSIGHGTEGMRVQRTSDVRRRKQLEHQAARS